RMLFCSLSPAHVHISDLPSFPTRRSSDLVAVGDRGDGVRLLRRHAARERGEAVQRLPNFLDAHRAASTNALRSCLAPSSTTVPMTTKSAPAARAARTCAGVRIPPPTKSGRSGGGTAARQA